MKETKFCVHCGEKIDKDAVFCTKCGCQVEELESKKESIIINNTNVATATAIATGGRPKNKWAAFFLCLFLGVFGAHKFYEDKIGLGILYLFTGGLCGIGCFVDLIIILCKSNPYYV